MRIEGPGLPAGLPIVKHWVTVCKPLGLTALLNPLGTVVHDQRLKLKQKSGGSQCQERDVSCCEVGDSPSSRATVSSETKSSRKSASRDQYARRNVDFHPTKPQEPRVVKPAASPRKGHCNNLRRCFDPVLTGTAHRKIAFTARITQRGSALLSRHTRPAAPRTSDARHRQRPSGGRPE